MSINLIEKIGSNIGYNLSLSNRPDLCDYQINSCFAIAKAEKKNPMDIASGIAEKIKDTEIDGIKVFSECTPCKPGFVNIKLSDKALIKNAMDLLSDKNLGVVKPENIINRALFDYGGANIAKPLHVGHLRVAVIGEALKRLYRRFGIEAIGDVHLGDFGLQMGLVIEELKDENLVDSFTTKDLETVYPKASARAKTEDEFSKRAHIATKKLQDNLEPETSIWKKILKISIEDLKKRYAELNVEFEYYFGESTVKDIMNPMVDDFLKKGIARISDGAVVIDVKEDSDKREFPPVIIRKNDGASLYATSDIATIKFREEDKNLNSDEYIYVVDKRQNLHLESCFRAAKLSHVCAEDKKFYHVQVGTMNGADGKPFKTRDGGVVKLETLINEAKEKALKALDNNRDFTGLDKNEIATKIAVAALKYGDLSNSPTRDYVFDIDKFLSFEGNTGPYILYTIVRIMSIFNKLGDINADKPSHSTDIICHNLLLDFVRYSEALMQAYKDKDPSAICKYIYGLSNDFNSFYHEHNIVNETDINKKSLYVLILKLTNMILRDSLHILAIDIPEKM